MTSNPVHQKAQIVYFSHGGGPLPILNDKSQPGDDRFHGQASIPA